MTSDCQRTVFWYKAYDAVTTYWQQFDLPAAQITNIVNRLIDWLPTLPPHPTLNKETMKSTLHVSKPQFFISI